MDEIQRLIKEEYSTPGSRLPTEAELAEKFQVSRIVVREAMKVLEDRGVVEVRGPRYADDGAFAGAGEGIFAAIIRRSTGSHDR